MAARLIFSPADNQGASFESNRGAGSLREGISEMTGQCFCGSVVFDGPTSEIEICHCSRCQRATGSPFAAEFRACAEVSLAPRREPEDVADVILFLASEQARWMTGQLIYVGGGWRMHQ